MKPLRWLSGLGIVLSMVVHLISWTHPDLLYVLPLCIPLQIVILVILPRLYSHRAFPLQKKADLRWLHHTSSVIHALLFLALMTLIFHTVTAVIGLSTIAEFVVRALSSIWLYIYAIGYGFASWAGTHNSRLTQLRGQGLHRHRIRNIAEEAKAELEIKATPPILRRRS